MSVVEFDRATRIEPIITARADVRRVHTLPPRAVTALALNEPVNPPSVKIATTNPNCADWGI
jgi:hypothetical protein